MPWMEHQTIHSHRRPNWTEGANKGAWNYEAVMLPAAPLCPSTKQLLAKLFITQREGKKDFLVLSKNVYMPVPIHKDMIICSTFPTGLG